MPIHSHRPRVRASAVLAVIPVLVLACRSVERAEHEAVNAKFVGTATCASCHEIEATTWKGSQHSKAMQHATSASVLGDFSDARVEFGGVRSRFFRNGERFLVETDGRDGQISTFEVLYTFGVAPLQQYLVEMDRGRLQALPIAWDTRPADQGGQRWFHLYPDEEITHDDVLHWTGPYQNWNHMCAECHSTGVRKNYDAASDSFATAFTEISIGCEGCHGEGSRHVAWAEAAPPGDGTKGLLAQFDERNGATWTRDTSARPVRHPAPSTLRTEVETCGRCHARRSTLSETWTPGRPLSATHSVSLIEERLYEADGQMVDEVYNYGSFRQSRMHTAGVTCSDCHDPHSATLRLPGDGTCLQCHSSERYARDSHTHHQTISPMPSCASCHMPTRTYMVVDERHDHGFRIPRPDLTSSLGVPNTCNACHRDRSPAWATDAIDGWYGPSRSSFQTWGGAFRAAWGHRVGAGALLEETARDTSIPSFVRASALATLSPHLTPANLALARSALRDGDPLVRLGALTMLDDAPPDVAWSLAAPLLSDSILSVRLRAVALLASGPETTQVGAANRESFARAADEFVDAQRMNADRPEARSALGVFLTRRGQLAEAEAEYVAALRISPQFTPAAVNLADLYRQTGRDQDAERMLRGGLVRSPRDPSLHHALGLTLVRLGRADSAIGHFRIAAELDPDIPRYAYVYAIALNSSGRGRAALTVLAEALKLHPADRDILSALVNLNRAEGLVADALAYAERLMQILPSADLRMLVEELRRQVGVDSSH